MSENREITIDQDYCETFNDYTTGIKPIKGIPQIYPINKENDNYTPMCK